MGAIVMAAAAHVKVAAIVEVSTITRGRSTQAITRIGKS